MSATLARSFLLGRTAGEAVVAEKRAALEQLAEHDLWYAIAALSIPGNAISGFNDYMTMRGAMLAGGLHRVRLTGGRGIDR